MKDEERKKGLQTRGIRERKQRRSYRKRKG
jgi:hypothetical protein